MKVMITGASGFIGGNLLKEILKRKFDWDIHILARNTSDLQYIENEKFITRIGDLTEPESLDRALKGIDLLFHCAAFFTLEQGRFPDFELVNVTGTKNLLQAALKANVKRIIYTSTGATIGIPPKGNMADENTEFNKHDFSNDYTLSKYIAEQVVFDYINKGLDIVIVNPVAPVGRLDVKPTPTGQFIVKYIKKEVNYFMDAVTHYVHLDDVLDGHIKAVSNGKTGEKYLLGSENFMMSEIYEILGKATGVRYNIVKLPYFFCLLTGYIIDLLKYTTKYQTSLGSSVVKYSRLTPEYNFHKARTELGITQTPLIDGFIEAQQWFNKHGYLD